MELNKIQSSGSWGKATGDLNQNFSKVNNAVEQVKNATTRNKGYFSSSDELIASFPSANKGDIAYVGSAYPYAIWKWNGSSWAKSGSTGGEESVNLGDYYTKVETDEKFTETDEKLSELGSKDFNNYFVGIGESFTFTQINGLIPNNTYRVFLRNNWEDASSNTSAMKLSIQSYDSNGTAKSLGGVKIGRVIPSFIDVTIPSDSVYVTIGGRALKDEKIWFYIEDLWLKYETENYSNISLINTVDFVPNIDTKTMTLDLGEDAILEIANKSYVLNAIHSDPSVYRAISLPVEGSISGALVLLFNTDTGLIYTKAYSNKRTYNEVVLGGIRLKYMSGSFKFISANLIFDFTIDGFNTEGKLSRNFIVGENNGFVRKKIEGLIPGNTYKVSLRDTNWDKTGVTVSDSSYVLFSIGYYKGDESFELKIVKVGGEVLSSYIFNVPEDSDSVYIGCRATLGEKVWYTIEDVTDIEYIRKSVLTNYFRGQGTIFVETKVESLIPNNTYRVFFKNDWEDASSNTSAMKLSIQSYDSNGTAKSLGGVKIGRVIPSFIDVTIPSDSVYVTIGGRALKDEKIWFTIEYVKSSDEVIFNGVSLINTSGFVPNIDTSSLTLDLGSDPVFAVGQTSYAMASIHSDSSIYRAINLPAEGSTSGALVMVFNTETKQIYTKAYKSKRETTEIIIGGVRLHYSSSAQKFTFVSANFIFGFTIDGQTNIEDDTSVVGLNGGIEELTSKFTDLCKRKGISGNSNYGNKICNIIFTSDAHNSTTYLSRIIGFKNTFADYIDDILHGGDAVRDQFVDDNPFANISGGEFVLNTIGNHDNWDSSNQTGEAINGRIPQKLVYDKFISPYISNWGNEENPITQPMDVEEYGYCYYCKDYTEAKVRLVVLDCMNYNDHQDNWLSEILDGAIAKGFHVIISNHYTPSNTYRPDYSCTFSSIYDNGYSIISACLPKAASNTVQSKMESGLSFICWLFGHYHRDFFGSLTDYPKQFGLAVDKTSPGSGWERDSCRSGNGREQDAFNIVSIDTTHGTMTVIRIGNNRDKFMRQKNYLTFDYINGQIIYNS